MPFLGRHDQARGIDFLNCAHRHLLGMSMDVLLEQLPGAVLAIQFLGEAFRAQGIARHQQIQRRLRGVEPAGGIQTRPQPETKVHARQRSAEGCDRLQRTQAAFFSVLQNLQAFLHQEPILLHQRNDVRHGAQRHQIEMLLQREALHHAAFQQGMGEFENNAGTAQVVKILAKLGIHHRHTIRKTILAAFVVIENNHIHAMLAFQPPDLCNGGGAAIHRDQQCGLALGKQPFQAFARHPITLLHAMRQKCLRLQAVSLQHRCQKRQRCHPIHVVIPEQRHFLLCIHRRQNPHHRSLHIRQQKGIGERFQFRI